MISLTPLINYLAPKPAGFSEIWFKQVAGAAEYAQLDIENLPLPNCWVIRASDKVSHAGERAENIDLGFDIVIAIENVRMHRPGETDDMLLKYRIAIKNLLLGWEIEPDVKPLKFDGGRVLEYAQGELFWADKYSFSAIITNYLPDPPAFDSIVATKVLSGEQL